MQCQLSSNQKNKFVRHAKSTAGNTFVCYSLYYSPPRLFDIVFRSGGDVRLSIQSCSIYWPLLFAACVEHTSKKSFAEQKFGSRAGMCERNRSIYYLFALCAVFFTFFLAFSILVNSMLCRYVCDSNKECFSTFFHNAIGRTIAEWALCGAHTLVRILHPHITEHIVWTLVFFFSFCGARIVTSDEISTVRFSIFGDSAGYIFVWFSNQNEHTCQRLIA